jgi:hypothetical protein
MYFAVLAEHDVVGLQIPVDNAAFVGVVDRLTDLEEDDAERASPGRTGRGSSSCIGVAVTWNSTWSGTVEPYLGSNRVGAQSLS